MRWAWRLFRREWRQQVLVLALLTVAVAAAIFGASAAYNLAPSRRRRVRHGRAAARAARRRSRGSARPTSPPSRTWFGAIDVIGTSAIPRPRLGRPLELRAQDPDGRTARRCWRCAPAATRRRRTRSRSPTRWPASTRRRRRADGRPRRRPRTVVGMVENPADLDDEFALVAPGAVARPESRDGPRRRRPTTASGRGRLPARPGRRCSIESAAARTRGRPRPSWRPRLADGRAAAGLPGRRRRLRRRRPAAAAPARHAGRDRRHRAPPAAGACWPTASVVGVVAAVAGAAIALSSPGSPRRHGSRRRRGHRIDRFDVPWWLIGGGHAAGGRHRHGGGLVAGPRGGADPDHAALSARPPRPTPGRAAVGRGRRLLVGLGFVGSAAGVDTPADKVEPAAARRPARLPIGRSACCSSARWPSGRWPPPAGRLPVAVRLALRDLARYQARSGAALAAISLALGIAVATVVIAAAAAPAADEGNLSDRQILIRIGRRRSRLIPDGPRRELERLRAAVDQWPRAVEDTDVVRARRGREPRRPRRCRNGQARATGRRRSGRAVGRGRARRRHPSTSPPRAAARTSGSIWTVDRRAPTSSPSEAGDLRLVNVSTIEGPAARPTGSPEPPIDVPAYSSVPRSLITPEELAGGDGIGAGRRGWSRRRSAPHRRRPLAAARDRSPPSGPDHRSEERPGRAGHDPLGRHRPPAMLLALGILAMTVGLIRSEAGRDLRTLAATGATSTTRRSLAAATAGRPGPAGGGAAASPAAYVGPGGRVPRRRSIGCARALSSTSASPSSDSRWWRPQPAGCWPAVNRRRSRPPPLE